MAEQLVLVGSTASLVSYPYLSAGGAPLLTQPTSATVRIGTPATPLPTSYDSATVDSLSTTLSADVDEGETSLPLAGSVSLVKGRRYLVGGLPVVVEHGGATGSIATLTAAEPLPTGVLSGDAVVGFAVSHALTALETASPGNALALWRAAIAGITYEWSQSFRVVRRIPQVPLSATELTQAYPIVHTLRARNDLVLEEVIRYAWRYRVLRTLEAKGVREEDIVSSDVLAPLLAIACVYHLAVQDPASDAAYVERLHADYEQSITSVLASRHWYEDPQSENPSPRPEGESPTPARGTLWVTR